MIDKEADRPRTVSDAPTRAADPRPARTRAALFAAARELAAEAAATPECAERFSVEAVARRAGVSRSTFYAQFPGLDALAATMLGQMLEDSGTMDVAARRQPSGLTARELARLAAERTVAHMEDHRPVYALLFGPDATMATYEAVLNVYTEQVRRILGELRLPPGVDGDTAARSVAGGQLALLWTWLIEPEPAPAAEFVDRLVAVLPPYLLGE